MKSDNVKCENVKSDSVKSDKRHKITYSNLTYMSKVTMLNDMTLANCKNINHFSFFRLKVLHQRNQNVLSNPWYHNRQRQ